MIRLSFLLVCIFVYFNSFNYVSTFDDNHLTNEGATISCTCGKDILKKRINNVAVEEILENIIKSKLSSTSILYYPDVIRNHFLKCSMCKISVSKCWGRSSSKKYTCKERLAEFVIYKNETVTPEYRDMLKYAMKNITSHLAEYDGSPSIRIQKRDIVVYPLTVHIPIGGLNTTRRKRENDWCHYPTSLQTSDLTCTHYPSKVTCIQKCAFGHTLNEGKQLQYKCRESEDNWRPQNFQECQPYVDCTISLTSGGKGSCKTATLDRGPVCSVKCHKFEDKPGTKTNSYQCDINGHWSPRLPFCAAAGSGIHLVTAPKSRHG
ncbi:uncharacterized protein [Parasteatoda tepidariorum]|uniref:uncharacterized protein n=1 Tax=Parasteatoda tepidariorum TaxID=114398 RepID=UPI001C71AAF5|nr:uncharacterized protein LOC107451485 isoform X2 [Parasteatoda tepidariorum]